MYSLLQGIPGGVGDKGDIGDAGQQGQKGPAGPQGLKGAKGRAVSVTLCASLLIESHCVTRRTSSLELYTSCILRTWSLHVYHINHMISWAFT